MPDTVLIKERELTVLKVDEAVNTTFVCEVRNRIGTSREQVAIFVRGELSATKQKKAHTTTHVHKKVNNQMLLKM